MQFLKSKVRGEADRLIQHLQISSDNYNVCWEILNNRYNNSWLIFTSHLDLILNLPVVQQANVPQIKKIHDTTLECLNSIRNLGVDIDSWDPFIVRILLLKLDADTHDHYLESLKKPRELPKLTEFLSFLESKFTALESSRKKNENSKPSTSKQNKSSSSNFKNKYSASKTSVNNIELTCPLCKESHGIYYCSKFLNMTPSSKRQAITRLHLCKNCLYSHGDKECTSEKRCRECRGKHNTLLHEAFNNKSSCNTITENKTPAVLATQNQESQENHVLQQGNNVIETLLATAMIKVQASDGSYHKMRALIDQGSQASLISARATQQLALSRKYCRAVICGIGEKESSSKGVTNITCCSHFNDFTFKTDVVIMDTLINQLPKCTFTKPTWAHLAGVQLADPEYNVSRPIDILLGADVYSHIILEGIIRADLSLPVAQQTRLGWILCGNFKTFQCNVVLNQVDEVQRFWEIEDITESSNLSAEDLQCMEYYKKTTTRHENGMYEVRLPFQENFETHLGLSKNKAMAQFQQLERKFHNNEELAKQYKLFIQEYKTLGHMIPASGNKQPDYYLPHHCVLRNDSTTTALRVVFNASSKTTTGTSLNDVMLKGPNLQQDLQSLLLRWRQYRVAFTADIEKMFRFIWLNKQDQKFQKIIWRDTIDMRHQVYQLCTVTYGTKAAPFLAMMTLKQLAEDERQNFDSVAIKALEQSFYMDDVLHGSHSIKLAVKLKQDLIRLLKSGGFNLRKWSSNASALLDDITIGASREQENFDFKEMETSKTLGLRWNSKADLFTFQSKIEPSNKTPTKRSMLSDISKLFDPLGWLSPISTKLKLLFQQVWISSSQWDDKLPDQISKEWLNIKGDMHKINQFKLERWLGTGENNTLELHGFCDSSNKAYACVVYCKTENNGAKKISLVAGKARLAPVNKSISLPKLELSGALLLAKLLSKIQQCLINHNIKIYTWTDSMVVLAWLQGEPGRWKPFVANRVRQISSMIPKESWRYVKSAENPADCASRGLGIDQLKNHSLWWEGPSWLRNYDPDHETGQAVFTTDEEARKAKQLINHMSQQESDNILGELLARYSSLAKLTRVLAWILRFIKQARDKKNRIQTYLTLHEIINAKHKIILYVQQREFAEEVHYLQENKPLSAKNKLLQLNPFLDNEGLLRVKGRLSKANINQNMMHPIIIAHEGHLTNLIIDQAHELTFHGGARVTSAFIRKNYWIIGGNRAVKKRIRSCVTCRKHNPNKMTQLMGDLPTQRCNVAKPFEHTGVDFTGHVLIKANKGRGIKTTKGYVVVFVCMVTKLVHLDLVSDLTSSAFIAALRRMAGRKGSPKHLYSDNGTNFVGANKILQEELEQIQETFDQDFIKEITSMEIEWHFNAPSWPTAGGLWEAAVKSLKYHLKRVVGEQKLTFEEFSTVLAQLEAVLNSRPLCPLTEDPNDLDFLSPSSFINLNQDMTVLETETDMRTRWHLTQKLVRDIWKRWHTEYLTQLSARSKWRHSQPDIQLNDIVTINDANLPPGKWAVGRVVQLHPGADGHIRVVTLKTKNGLIKRPILKLSILPVNDRINKQELRSKEDGKSFQNKKVNYSFSLLVTLLLSFMSILTTAYGSYNVTQLKDNQGLYFDKIANMQLIRDEWKIVTYYEMNSFWQGTKACSKYLGYLDQLCNKFKETSHCDVIQVQLQQEFSELEYYNHLLLSQHSSTRRARDLRRRKRGLIDGVGYLANGLFGVLDERFAEQYKQDIQSIHDNENHLLSLMKQQTTVIEAEYNILKRNGQAINKQHKMLNTLSIKLDKMENVLLNESERNQIMNDFNTGAIATSNVLRQLKTIQTSLLDTITDVYHGRLNIHLLSPEQLKDTLNTISSHLSKDLTLPINNLQKNFRNIYHLLTVKARMTEEFLIFELKLPLVSRDTFSIMKIITIPQPVGNSSMATLTPIAEYVAINLKKDSYLPMSINDVQVCLRDNVDNYLLCHIEKPIYHLKNNDKFCEVEPDSSKCKISITTCSNQWTALSKINNYAFFCCSQCEIRVLCDDNVSPGQLVKAGILGVEHDCLIKTESFTVYSRNEGFSTLDIKPSFNLPEIEPINHIIDVSIPTPLIENYTLLPNNEELDEIKKQLRILKASENLPNQLSYHDIHHYTAYYVMVGVVLVVGVVYMVRRLRNRRTASLEVARAALASLQATQHVTPARAEAGASISSSTVQYSVSARNQCDNPCASDYSEIPKVHKSDKCTVPMSRKTEFK